MMQAGRLWRKFVKRLLRRHGDIKSFDTEIKAAGGQAARMDRGLGVVPTEKIVGSVGRAQNLRSDFFYKHGQAVTDRFLRIGSAIRAGKTLPPLELYKVKRQPRDAQAPLPGTEYYVVDGHHRVAMARKLGQDFLDAHVVEYQVGAQAHSAPDEVTLSDQSAGSDADPAPAGTSNRSGIVPEA